MGLHVVQVVALGLVSIHVADVGYVACSSSIAIIDLLLLLHAFLSILSNIIPEVSQLNAILKLLLYAIQVVFPPWL